MRVSVVSSLRLTVLATALAGSTAAFAAAGLADRTATVSAGLADRTAATYAAGSGRPVAVAAKGGSAATLNGALALRGRDAATLASLRQSGDAHTGKDAGAGAVTHLRYEQTVAGLPVYGAYAKAAYDKQGNLVHLIDALAPIPASSAVAAAKIDAAGALKAAMASVHPGVSARFSALSVSDTSATFDGGSLFSQAPEVRAVVVPMSDGTLARGWLVTTWTAKDNLLDETLVGGDGRVLKTERRTATHAYNVYTVDPLHTPQAIVNGPNIWLSSIGLQTLGQVTRQWIIQGNNVNAYLDRDNNDGADGAVAGDTMTLTTPWNAAEDPTSYNNKKVALTNLFYFNNVIHDILYSHGFTESAGNFQLKGIGAGGLNKDPVNAEAQDGGGTNNANFSTPGDGQPPRMQMYLWSGGGHVHISSPVAADYQAGTAGFGPALSPTATLTGAIAQATPYDACSTVGASVAGKIAVVQRGTCAFIAKVRNAQAAGATGVIVVNNVAGFISMGSDGSTPIPTIPAVMVTPEDGAAILALAAPVGTLSGTGQLDGDLDSGIVFHEYGHGLTWRMIGGMSGTFAGAIGEGASDGVAMLVNGSDIMGDYANANPLGIRRYPYHNYPLTYKDWTSGEVHNDGEIFAAAVWRMIELFGPESRSRLFDYYVDGMNYIPSTPKPENMRDGFLQAASASQADKCMIWKAFAQFGIGVGAAGNSGGSTIHESFTVPAECQ